MALPPTHYDFVRKLPPTFAFPPFAPALIASSGSCENDRLSAGTDFSPCEAIERRFSKSIAAKPFGFFVSISSSGSC